MSGNSPHLLPWGDQLCLPFCLLSFVQWDRFVGLVTVSTVPGLREGSPGLAWPRPPGLWSIVQGAFCQMCTSPFRCRYLYAIEHPGVSVHLDH